ncbi:hypothetical protein ACH5RR_039648 [Cinchona calisaya]|uniref:Uncharacterized protein n=1 Tax=Cinchona calisaya TaxID=153742 RepID=A0ABD2Y1I2_9GENT
MRTYWLRPSDISGAKIMNILGKKNVGWAAISHLLVAREIAVDVAAAPGCTVGANAAQEVVIDVVAMGIDAAQGPIINVPANQDMVITAVG